MLSIALDTDNPTDSCDTPISSCDSMMSNVEPKDVGSPFVSMPAIPMSEYMADDEALNLEKVLYFSSIL